MLFEQTLMKPRRLKSNYLCTFLEHEAILIVQRLRAILMSNATPRMFNHAMINYFSDTLIDTKIERSC